MMIQPKAVHVIRLQKVPACSTKTEFSGHLDKCVLFWCFLFVLFVFPPLSSACKTKANNKITILNNTAPKFNQSSRLNSFRPLPSLLILFNCWLLLGFVISHFTSWRQCLGKSGLLTAVGSCRITLPIHPSFIVPLSRSCR